MVKAVKSKGGRDERRETEDETKDKKRGGGEEKKNEMTKGEGGNGNIKKTII